MELVTSTSEMPSCMNGSGIFTIHCDNVADSKVVDGNFVVVGGMNDGNKYVRALARAFLVTGISCAF